MKNYFLIFLAFCLSACSAMRTVPTTERVRDSVQVSVVHDSVYIHDIDSVMVVQYLRGDTVYIDRDRIRIKYQTIYKDRIDTVTIVQTLHQTINPSLSEAKHSIIKSRIPRWCWACVGLLIMTALAFMLRLARLFR